MIKETQIATPFVKTVSSSTVPEVLGAYTVKFTSITFIGMKAARTNNTGTVWIQFVNTDGSPGIPVLPGEIKTWNAPFGKYADASMFWIDAVTNGDGVVAIPAF